MTRILNLETHDLRFPTSAFLDGSDAMNPDPDYSAAYVVLSTDHPRGLAGDSQLRWLGPEKGVIHLALAAVVNAIWDLWAKSVGKPVWKLVADLSPEEFVSLLDFRHIEDVLTPAEGLEILHSQVAGKATREARLRAEGYPAYTTSVGWLGYDDDKLRRLCRESLAHGWQNFKMKVGRNLTEDLRRCAIVREEIGPHRRLMIDANQVWEVGQAIEWVQRLSRFDPWWIEEPLSPDDILGHGKVARAARPVRVATGEHAHNRVMFKQLLDCDAVDVVQPDACRLGGLNEVLSVLLLAAKFGKPVCPHAGGVGLCEYAQHISMIDFLAVSGRWEQAMCEYTQHLHEHFVEPIDVRDGRYRVPLQAGFSAQMRSESIAEASYREPDTVA